MENPGIIFLKAKLKEIEATSRFHIEFQFSNKFEEISFTPNECDEWNIATTSFHMFHQLFFSAIDRWVDCNLLEFSIQESLEHSQLNPTFVTLSASDDDLSGA